MKKVVLVSLLLILNRFYKSFCVSNIDFEQANNSWVEKDCENANIPKNI